MHELAVRAEATDLAMLLGAWGPCNACAPDLDDDGMVDSADLAVLLGNWGSPHEPMGRNCSSGRGLTGRSRPPVQQYRTRRQRFRS